MECLVPDKYQILNKDFQIGQATDLNHCFILSDSFLYYTNAPCNTHEKKISNLIFLGRKINQFCPSDDAKTDTCILEILFPAKSRFLWPCYFFCKKKLAIENWSNRYRRVQNTVACGVLSLVLFAAIVCHVLKPVIQYCTYCLFAAFYPRKNEVCELLLRATENMRSLIIQLK